MVCRIKKLFLVWTLLLAFFAQSFAAVLPAFAEELYSEGTVDITGGSCLDPIAEGYATGQSALAYTDEIGIKKVYIRKSGESFTAGEIIIQRHLDGQTTIIRREPIKQDGTYLIPFLEDGQYSVCALPYDGTKYSTSHAFSFQVINGVMSPDTPLIVLDIEPDRGIPT